MSAGFFFGFVVGFIISTFAVSAYLLFDSRADKTLNRLIADDLERIRKSWRAYCLGYIGWTEHEHVMDKTLVPFIDEEH